MATSSLASSRYFASLSYPDYRRLFLSTSATGLANWTLIVGRGWLAYHLTASSTWVGVVTFAGFLPFILGPIGGVLADRYERRRLAALSTGIGFAFSIALALLTMAGAIEVWQLAVLTVAMSVPRAAELPARQALISNTVPAESLVNAVSLSSVATFGTRAVGPAVVIPMIDTLGVEGVFLLAAAFYALSSIAVLRIDAFGLPSAPVGRSAMEDMREGLAYVLGTPSVATVMLLVMIHCALTMSFDSLLPVFAVTRLESHGGASFSMLAMGVGVGALAGSFYAGGMRDDSAGRMLLVVAIISGLSPMLMALPMDLMSLPVALTGTITMGASQAAFMALCGAMVQSAAPDALRGRVMSLYLLFAGGLMAWVNLINGALADVWHVPVLFLAPAAAYLVLLSVMYIVRLPLRNIFRDGSLARVQPELAAIP